MSLGERQRADGVVKKCLDAIDAAEGKWQSLGVRLTSVVGGPSPTHVLAQLKNARRSVQDTIAPKLRAAIDAGGDPPSRQAKVDALVKTLDQVTRNALDTAGEGKGFSLERVLLDQMAEVVTAAAKGVAGAVTVVGGTVESVWAARKYIAAAVVVLGAALAWFYLRPLFFAVKAAKA